MEFLSPLWRYYASILGMVAVALAVVLVRSRASEAAAIGLIGILAIYLTTLKCPRCGRRLGREPSVGTGFGPGRTCAACGNDLSKRL